MLLESKPSSTYCTPRILDRKMFLLTLPIELRHKIYKLLMKTGFIGGSKTHLKRLSACSKALRQDIAPLLWANVTLTWKPKSEAVMRNFVYTKNIVFDFLGSRNEEKDVLCKTFKTHIEHCGANLETMIVSEYNLDCSALREVKKLPNLKELWFTKFPTRGSPQLMTVEDMQEISQFASLERLELCHEKLEPNAFKALCSESLVSLKSLMLEESRLTDPGLTKLKNLSSLVSLTLTDASITHVGLKRINGLPKLKELDLNHCKRIKFVPILDALPSLRKLNLKGTSINDGSLINLKALPSLSRLNISFCKNITAVGFDSLIVLPSLEVLRCEGVLSFEEMELVKSQFKCVVQDNYLRKGYDPKNDPWYMEVEDSRCCLC